MSLSPGQMIGLFDKVCAGCRRPRRLRQFLDGRGPSHANCAQCREKESRNRKRTRERDAYRKRHPGFQRYLKRRAAMVFIQALAVRRIQKGKGVNWMPEEYAVRLAKLPDRIAAIIGKTYSEVGDSAPLADDTAVGMIRDLLNELDERLIERNKNKRLSKRA
jgi:hypothetical protein